ncbi:MAG: ATP-binding protein [Gemmatimonadaceae bacterium]
MSYLREPLGGPAAIVFPVDDVSRVGEVRRAAEVMGLAAGLDNTENGALSIVVTEMATNLARHATSGRVLLTTVGDLGARVVQVLAIDEGPGIGNVGAAMTDGFSSAGTAGKGLGAMSRMAHEFALYSRRGPENRAGTIAMARMKSRGARAVRDDERSAAGVVCVPITGERDCGDSWSILRVSPDVTLLTVVDGLGHGLEAAEASTEALRVVRASPDQVPSDLINSTHAALRSTRGAAMAIARVDFGMRRVTFSGIGNISASVHQANGASRGMSSHNGTVGHVMKKAQDFVYDWPAQGTMVLHSDGIHTHWRLDPYPGLNAYDPAILAALLFRDASRGRDDVTVVAFRELKS